MPTDCKPSSFLCPELARRLTREPHRCLRCWQERSALTAALVADEQWQSAYRLAGATFEIALLMMRHPEQCNADWLRRYRASKQQYAFVCEGLCNVPQREARSNIRLIHTATAMPTIAAGPAPALRVRGVTG